MKRDVDASTLWFTAAELGNLMREYGDVAAQGGGLDWGIAKLDKTMIPSRAGQLNFIIARPGNGKTTIAAIRAKRAAKRIMQHQTQDKECVVVISLDQAVEEVFPMMTANRKFTVSDLAWGRVPHEALVQHALDSSPLPVRMIGKSVMRRSNTQMTFDQIFAAIDDIYKTHKVTPTHVMLDYIQIARTSNNPYKSKAEQVSEAVQRAADLSFAYGCTIDICAQAGREVDKNAIKLPALSDCQWASAIEQEGYKVISVWRPVLTEGMGAKLKLFGNEFIVSQDLLVMRLLKQKMEAAGYTYILKLDPASVELFDWELQR